MQIILLEDVDNLGSAGDVVEVADGYARNYLLPQQIANRATPENMTDWEHQQKQRQQMEDKKKRLAEETAEKIEGAALTTPARAGEEGKLFGSITTQNIADALAEKTGVEIDRRDIQLDEPLSVLGEYEVYIRLHPEVSVTIEVEVVPEED